MRSSASSSERWWLASRHHGTDTASVGFRFLLGLAAGLLAIQLLAIWLPGRSAFFDDVVGPHWSTVGWVGFAGVLLAVLLIRMGAIVDQLRRRRRIVDELDSADLATTLGLKQGWLVSGAGGFQDILVVNSGRREARNVRIHVRDGDTLERSGEAAIESLTPSSQHWVRVPFGEYAPRPGDRVDFDVVVTWEDDRRTAGRLVRRRRDIVYARDIAPDPSEEQRPARSEASSWNR